MDLIFWSVFAPSRLRVDVSVRDPCKAKYSKKAAFTDGVALEAAIREKQQRYGADVLCVLVESYGKQGSGVHACLNYIADFAPKPVPRGGRRRWNLLLGMALARNAARALRESAVPGDEPS